jgi:hypothetical protein
LEGSLLYTVEAKLQWYRNPDFIYADYDLYGAVETNPAVYFNNLTDGVLTLNHDAHPDCNSTPTSPETITSISLNTDSNFRFWFNRYADCGIGSLITIKTITINNIGTSKLIVTCNSPLTNQNVAPGASCVINMIYEYDVRGEVENCPLGTTVYVWKA